VCGALGVRATATHSINLYTSTPTLRSTRTLYGLWRVACCGLFVSVCVSCTTVTMSYYYHSNYHLFARRWLFWPALSALALA
jgi:hypothetical protein